MKQAVVVISYTGTYGWNTVIECIHSIRKYNETITIIIVNNYNEPCIASLLQDTNIRYIVNESNTYELGAIKKVISSTHDIDYYYMIHDSCRILNDMIDFKDTNTMFWKTSIQDIAPVLHIVRRWSELHFKSIVYNDIQNVLCQGLMGYFSHTLLKNMIDDGLQYIDIHNKLEAVASEGLFGILLKKYCPTIISYYSNKLDDYISNRSSHLFLQKLSGGKNPQPIGYTSLQINVTSIAHPNYSYLFTYHNITYESLQSALSIHKLDKRILLEYYAQNRNALNILTEFPQYDYQIIQYQELSNMLNTLRHILHIIRHFQNIPIRTIYNDNEHLVEEIRKNGNTNFITDSGLVSGQQFFAIGDSHTIFFYNSMKIKEHWGFGGKIPVTIYTLLQDDFNPYDVGTRLGNGHELYNIKSGDYVLFFYGFNDIQRNIYLHAKDRWKEEIDSLLAKYIQKLVSIRNQYHIHIIVPCIYPNPGPNASGINSTGSNEERQMYTEYANQQLRAQCAEYHIIFLDIYNMIVDEERQYIKTSMTVDFIHLDYNNRELQEIVENNIISCINYNM